MDPSSLGGTRKNEGKKDPTEQTHVQPPID
jgi:hypothetical protein